MINTNNNFLRVLFGIIVAFLVLLLIPAILNYLLQFESPINVIGGDKSAKVWLAFWGAYLSAVGSGMLAIITVYDSRNNRKQRDKDNKIAILREEYSSLERSIIMNERIHSYSNILDIYYLIKKGKTEVAKRHVVKWQDSVKNASLYAVRYFSNDNECENYYTVVYRINTKAMEAGEKLLKILDDEPLQKSKYDDIKSIAYDYTNNTLNMELLRAGFELIKAKKNELNSLLAQSL